MSKNYVSAKIHGMRVTHVRTNYHGSQGIPQSLLDASGIEPFEQVHCINVTNGERWVTYAIPGPEGECSLNGGAARKGVVGDELIIIAYRTAERFEGAQVVMIDERNEISDSFTYDPPQNS